MNKWFALLVGATRSEDARRAIELDVEPKPVQPIEPTLRRAWEKVRQKRMMEAVDEIAHDLAHRPDRRRPFSPPDRRVGVSPKPPHNGKRKRTPGRRRYDSG